MPTPPLKPASAPDYPLFFSNPSIISLQRHEKAKMRGDMSMAFAAGTNSIPLAAADIAEAAKHYPIAFSNTDTVIPVAIVGLEQQNYFVDAQGTWAEGCYIPSYVRKYPFVFMETPGEDQLTLCIDEPALSFDAKVKGTPLYEEGKPSAFTLSALEFCKAYQEQHQLTRDFCDALKAKELLLPQRSDVELANGRQVQLGGFQLLNEAKFRALPQADLATWHRRGFLALAYYALQSHSNWQHLLERGNKREGKK